MKSLPTTTKQRVRNARPYTGVLAKPIAPASVTDSNEDQSELLRIKVTALFEHYGLKPDKTHPLTDASPWADLAFALARNHVPGFMPPSAKQGRPPTRQNDDLPLTLLVELYVKQGLSEAAAHKEISSRIPSMGTAAAIKKRLQNYTRSKYVPELLEFSVRLGGSDISVMIDKLIIELSAQGE